VANQFSNTVEAFSYDASTGALLPLNTYTAGSNPSGLAFSRCAGITQGTTSCPAADGNNLFVTNSGSNNVSIFAACIQLSTTCSIPNGSLVQIRTSPVAAGDSPVAIFAHPLLGFVYAVNSKGNDVTQYRYGSATGALTTLTPASVNAGSNPVGGGVTSDGSYVFVSNNNGSSMSVFSVGPGGKLAPGATSTVTLAGQPAAILVR
jgi:6-phosphogluconolactonase (cycloisomerase 2 family)